MANELHITDEAVIEIDDAIEYYKDKSHVLADDLQFKILELLDDVLMNPLSCPVIKDYYRKRNVDRFPYKIVYYINKQTVVVVALQHHKRKPFYWRGR